MAGEEEMMCVSGSWVMLSFWLVRLLLLKGYRVRTTVRTTVDEAAAFMALEGAEERLELSHADLLHYHSLARAFSGCVGVFHTCQPLNLEEFTAYPQESIDYEVRATLNVVEASANCGTVKRLILTSSASAVVWTDKWIASLSECGQGKPPAVAPLDERCWSNVDFCRDNKLWFPLLKTVVERNAWALALDKRLDLVVINPALVVGPKESRKSILSDIKGTKELSQQGFFAYAHVEDVAQAHILAFEKPEASGRYLCFERLLSENDILELAQRSGQKHSRPSRVFEVEWPCGISNEKIKGLGVCFKASTDSDLPKVS